VLKRGLVQAFLLVGPGIAALSAISTPIQAAEECRSRPGPTAPAGSRWLYWIDRADHRHCWFLSSAATGLNSQLSRSHRHRARDLDAIREGQEHNSNLHAVAEATDNTDAAVSVQPSPGGRVAIPLVDQSSQNLVPRSVHTFVYRLSPPNAQTVTQQTVDAPKVPNGTPASASNLNVIFLAGTAAAGLIFAGGVFHFARRVQPLSRVHVIVDQHDFAVRTTVAPEHPPPPTNPADELERSLRALTRNLQRASKMRVSHPSYADDSSPAISLPPAAAWLNRVHAEPTIEPTSFQFSDA
jgi:hypothetical protein